MGIDRPVIVRWPVFFWESGIGIREWEKRFSVVFHRWAGLMARPIRQSPLPIPRASMHVRCVAPMAPLVSLDCVHAIGLHGVEVYEVFTEPADISHGTYNCKTGIRLQITVSQHIGTY
ncbi:hypothetical protein FHY34_000604 [Xanthomonas arboricola]|uniref:hypothetical protein n=1 Tax=Xanthomonas arboricola TaxID=56448 RepID=UPI0011B03ADA|nr:hypothetical protein [Xanthomonas arboricola]MBB4706783.1 hypothetical protein [Xanthomonas arboricola]